MTEAAAPLRSLAAEYRHEIEVKRSRFLALATPCQSAEQALQWIASQSDPAATHNCWAFRIGQSYRFNDDGEPGGTAGRPILAAIDGQGLDRVAVLVIRWFGGTKLGAGGLVRAYGGCAAQCLQQAEQVELIAHRQLVVHCDFALEASLRKLLAESDGEILVIDYQSDGLRIELEIPTSNVETFSIHLRDISRGQARISDD